MSRKKKITGSASLKLSKVIIRYKTRQKKGNSIQFGCNVSQGASSQACSIAIRSQKPQLGPKVRD